jgi:hypothetical protein
MSVPIRHAPGSVAEFPAAAGTGIRRMGSIVGRHQSFTVSASRPLTDHAISANHAHREVRVHARRSRTATAPPRLTTWYCNCVVDVDSAQEPVCASAEEHAANGRSARCQQPGFHTLPCAET